MCFERKDERSKSKTGMGVWNAGHVPVIVRREQSVSDLVWDGCRCHQWDAPWYRTDMWLF